MTSTQVPLVVCITGDAEMRQTLTRRLDGFGVVLMVSNIDQLRTVLFASDRELPASAPEPEPHRGDLLVDVAGHRATWRSVPLRLTRMELRLLASLATPPVSVWSHDRLYITVWGGSYLGDASVVHAAMKRLRQKLRAAGEGITIETVRGVGYRLTLS